MCELFGELGKKTYVLPNGQPETVRPETMRKWLYRYNHGGINALSDKTRSDKGSHDVPQSLVKRRRARGDSGAKG